MPVLVEKFKCGPNQSQKNVTFKQIPPLKVTESEKSSATKSEPLEKSAEILSNSSSMSKPEKSPLPKEGSKSPLPKMGSKEKSPSLEIGDLEKVEHYMESPAKDFDADEDMEENDSKQEYTAVCELQMKTNTPASSGLDQDAKQIRSPTHSLASSSSGSYR